jgi:hypothetical protein
MKLCSDATTVIASAGTLQAQYHIPIRYTNTVTIGFIDTADL